MAWGQLKYSAENHSLTVITVLLYLKKLLQLDRALLKPDHFLLLHALTSWVKQILPTWLIPHHLQAQIYLYFVSGGVGKKDKLNNVLLHSPHHLLAIYHKSKQMTCRALSGAEHHAVGQ